MEFLRWLLAAFQNHNYILDIIIITYGIVVGSTYLILSFLSVLEISKYSKKTSFVNYEHIVSSQLAPSISVLAPSYNEGLTIIENIRSLLTINYDNYEVVIINDGSTDNTMEKIEKAYHLKKIDYYYGERIKTEKLKGIYKSTNPAYEKLVVIDKENGGKADALNMGLNYSNREYVMCVDVDCILHPEAISRLVKPFLDRGSKKVIAAGGVVRIANSCEIKDGKIERVHLAKKLLPKFQIIEYLRAFLLGRMAWSRLNGLLLVSGAFGLFDRHIAVEAGGYDSKTVGEDLELVMRMRKYYHKEFGPNYKTAYIPDPLCWTQVPDTYKVLRIQRDRWTRGGVQSILKHKDLFFNPKFGLSGMFSFLYLVIIEWLAPLVEFLGLVYFILLVIFDLVDWPWFLSLFLAVYSFMLMYSFLAILIEEFTFHSYPKKRDILKLVLVAFLEPFLFHFFLTFSTTLANVKMLFKLKSKNSWGNMERRAFKKFRKAEKSPV